MKLRHARLTVPIVALAGTLASLLARSASAAPPAPQPTFSRQTTQLIVPIQGTLEGAPEDIALNGRARIRSTAFTDPDLGDPPGVILAIDFLNVIGVGQATGSRYFAHGENIVVRALRASDLVELTFPLSPVGARETEAARSVLASFSLSFDLNDGTLKAAIASFSSPALGA